jgi:hypothetical protein
MHELILRFITKGLLFGNAAVSSARRNNLSVVLVGKMPAILKRIIDNRAKYRGDCKKD